MSTTMLAEPGLQRLVGFGRLLRGRGLPVGTGRILTFCRAVAALDRIDRTGVYWAGRVAVQFFYFDRSDVRGLPLRERKKLLKRSVKWTDRVRFTPSTITSEKALRRELEEVRAWAGRTTDGSLADLATPPRPASTCRTSSCATSTG